MSDAPQDVELEYADGTKVPCTVSRAPEHDRSFRGGTIEYYLARPQSKVDAALTYKLNVGTWPAKTGISVDFGQDGDFMGAMAPLGEGKPNSGQ